VLATKRTGSQTPKQHSPDPSEPSELTVAAQTRWPNHRQNAVGGLKTILARVPAEQGGWGKLAHTSEDRPPNQTARPSDHWLTNSRIDTPPLKPKKTAFSIN